MNSMFVPILLLLILVYLILFIIWIDRKITAMKINDMISRNTSISNAMNMDMETVVKTETMKTMAWEDALIKKMGLKTSNASLAIYTLRVVLLVTLTVLLVTLRGLGLALVLSIIVMFLFDDMYKKMVYKSGITNIPKVVSFINFFVPRIKSGLSADQVLAIYIQTSADEELADFYKNKENKEYKVPVHIKQIVDIYRLALYNENMGQNDYSYILMQMSEDINQKSAYYNKFLGAMSEIKPIGLSFVFGIPIFILVSYDQTKDFWRGPYGWMAGLAIVALFATYKFLIYKLQEKTVKKIF